VVTEAAAQQPCKSVEGSAVVERVSSIPALASALRGRFLACCTLLLLLLPAASARAQVGRGEWSPAVEAGLALPALTEPLAPGAEVALSLTSALLPGPAWTGRLAVTTDADSDLTPAASVTAVATLDALAWVPYAGLSAGLRWQDELQPTAGLLLGVDHRTERDHATGLQIRIDAPLDSAHGPTPAWSGALTLSYRWIVDSLATPQL
jgi:hypothetical protein